MKHLKTFEGRKPLPLTRKADYKFLSEEDAEKIEKIARDFIEKQDIPKRISELKLTIFVSVEFDYYEVFLYLLTSRDQHLYGPDNIYYVIDTYRTSKYDMTDVSTSAVRNTLSKVLKKLYLEFNIKALLDKKLIEILEKNPDKYKDRFDIYEDELSKSVKDTCKWMLDYRKYNL